MPSPIKQFLKFSRGVSALPLILMISGVIILIAASAALQSYRENQANLSNIRSAEAFQYAESGYNEALLRIDRDKNLNTSFNLSFDNNKKAEVKVEKNVPTLGQTTITSVGFSYNVQRGLKCVIQIDEVSGLTKTLSCEEILVSSALYCDNDGDGHYSKVSSSSCTGSSTTLPGDDCDDSCATCYPGSTAITAAPDGKDQDCNGIIDDYKGMYVNMGCMSFESQGCETQCEASEMFKPNTAECYTFDIAQDTACGAWPLRYFTESANCGGGAYAETAGTGITCQNCSAYACCAGGGYQ